MLKIYLPCDPVISLWAYTHTLYPTIEVIAHPHSLLLYLQQSRCPLTEEWIMKMWYFYTMGYYSAVKKRIHR